MPQYNYQTGFMNLKDTDAENAYLDMIRRVREPDSNCVRISVPDLLSLCKIDSVIKDGVIIVDTELCSVLEMVQTIYSNVKSISINGTLIPGHVTLRDINALYNECVLVIIIQIME